MDPSSIFRPQSSVYASLDNLNDHSPAASPRIPPPPPSFDSAEDDPFNTVALPSAVISPPLSPPPQSFNSPNLNNAYPTDAAPPPPRTSHLNHDSNALGDSKSPFHPEPLDSIFLTTPHELLSPALPPDRLRRERDLPSAAPYSRIIVPPAQRPSLNSTSSGSMSGMIGNRSLMGLLGGTRYEPRGFDSIRDDRDDEDDEAEERDSISVAESRMRPRPLFVDSLARP